jgi:hypothetical protein
MQSRQNSAKMPHDMPENWQKTAIYEEKRQLICYPLTAPDICKDRRCKKPHENHIGDAYDAAPYPTKTKHEQSMTETGTKHYTETTQKT